MFKAIILAAGKGSRMKSDLPKVLHTINDKTLVQYVIDAVSESEVNKIFVVVSDINGEVAKSVNGDVTFIEQKETLGTGHAVMQAEQYIEDTDDVIVLTGDTPLITATTIDCIRGINDETWNAVTILTAKIDDPKAYGRILRDAEHQIIGIVEKKDATEQQLAIKEINSGIYCFQGKALKDALKLIENNNNQKEYYLTDTIKIINDKGLGVGGCVLEDYTEVLGINTQEELENAKRIVANNLIGGKEV